MYIAVHFVDLGDHIAAPKELIEHDPNAEFHLRVGAIRKWEPAASPITPVMDQRIEPPKEIVEQVNGDDLDDDGEREADVAEEDFDEPEAPEVDVTDALIQAEEKAQEEKPKAAPRGKRASAKGGKAK